jgi:hypothetical protein
LRKDLIKKHLSKDVECTSVMIAMVLVGAFWALALIDFVFDPSFYIAVSSSSHSLNQADGLFSFGVLFLALSIYIYLNL